jgi:hypothetical protein
MISNISKRHNQERYIERYPNRIFTTCDLGYTKSEIDKYDYFIRNNNITIPITDDYYDIIISC